MIRTATPADLDAIVRLHTEARATYYRGHLPGPAYAGEAEDGRSRDGWAGAIDRDAATVLVAEPDGILAGVAAYSARDGMMHLSQLQVAARSGAIRVGRPGSPVRRPSGTGARVGPWGP